MKIGRHSILSQSIGGAGAILLIYYVPYHQEMPLTHLLSFIFLIYAYHIFLGFEFITINNQHCEVSLSYNLFRKGRIMPIEKIKEISIREVGIRALFTEIKFKLEDDQYIFTTRMSRKDIKRFMNEVENLGVETWHLNR